MVVRDPVRLARGVCNGDKYKFDGKGERERETEGWGGLVGCRSDGLQVAKEDYQEGAGEALTEGWQSDGEARKGNDEGDEERERDERRIAMGTIYLRVVACIRRLTSCAGMTCHARREFSLPKLRYFHSFLSVFKYNPGNSII